MKSERKNICQPTDWWEAFAANAQSEGLSMSEWLGNAGRAHMHTEAETLSERPPANRPKGAK
jgi:hypothetical protein